MKKLFFTLAAFCVLASTAFGAGMINGGFGFRPYTTAQRDAVISPREGFTVYNSDTNSLESYSNSAWISLRSVGTTGEITFLNDIIVPNTIQIGMGTTYKSSYDDDGDLYANGKGFFEKGLSVRAARYGPAYQARSSSPTKTLSYDIGATFTAATAIIEKAGQTFVNDGVVVGDVLRITGASDSDYKNATGEVIKVTETQITVSIAAAGSATPDNLTAVNFVIFNHPLVLFSDNGDFHFSIGVNELASFHLQCSEGNNQHAFHIEDTANIDFHTSQTIDTYAEGNNSVVSSILNYRTGNLAVSESGAGQLVLVDDTDATSADSTTRLAGIAFITPNASNANKSALVVTPGWDNGFVVQGAEAENPAYGYENTSGTSTERVNGAPQDGTAFLSTSTSNLTIFDNDDDYIIIGSAAKFEVLSVTLLTGSSKSIAPVYYYSKAGGNWTVLPILGDSTGGMQNSGDIIFSAPADWTKDDEDMDGNAITDAYYVINQRTYAPTIPTLPVEGHFETYASQSTGMSIDGSGFILPRSALDAIAPNRSIYESIDSGKLVYKNSVGAVNDLY